MVGLACGGRHRASQGAAAVLVMVLLLVVAAVAVVEERCSGGGEEEGQRVGPWKGGVWEGAGEVVHGEEAAVAMPPEETGRGQRENAETLQIQRRRDGLGVARREQQHLPLDLRVQLFQMGPARGGSSRKSQVKADGDVGGGTVEVERMRRRRS